ncbi:MAG: hypothetical protein ACRDNJ_08150, partial [Solirubrobacteraceae bacterium]
MTQHKTKDPDALSGMLDACDPIRKTFVLTPELDRALDAVGEAIAAYPVRGMSRGPKRWLVAPRRAIAVAAALASAGGVAAAAKTLFIPTRTHSHPPRWAITGAGPGEGLNVQGTDFRRIALSLSAGIPYPQGYASWRDYVVTVERAPYGKVASGQVRGAFAMSAICAWVLDWRQATLNGDRPRAVHDTAVLTGAMRWPAVTAWDPHPSVSVPGDSGTTHPSTFGWAIPYIAAIKADDPAKLD